MHALRLLLLIFSLAINSANASGINDTGITTCGNASQNGLPCPVSGFPRQDAEYGPNTFSFTKLDAAGNPLPDTATNQVCMFDGHTGLVWEVKTDDGGLRDKDNTYTFDSAAAFATAVNTAGGLCGFTDWRVPNPQELAGLTDLSIPYPGPTINTSYFPNSLGTYFWTNSSYAYDSSYAWVVYFDGGFVYSHDRTNSNAVRLVRGGQSFSSFHSNGDGTVTDATTGLMWSQCALGQSGSSCSGSATGMNWGSALTAATTSTLAGYNDWRVPNAKELHSLVKYSAYNPSIDTAYFPNASYYMWSSSSYADDSSSAWFVNFGYGFVDSNSRANGSAVRLVRGGQWLFSFFLLHVNKAGSGAGTVTSTPAGISCGTVCTGSYASGSVLTLAAIAANANFFAGWGGACSGNAATCTVTMDAAKNVTATFNLITYVVTPSATTGGTFTPNTAQTVNYGTTKSFTVTPNTGYVRNASVGGTCPQGSWNSDVWTTGAITANCSVKFGFTQVYTVTPNTSTGGSLSPNTPQIINIGTTAQFTLTPNTGYSLDAAVGGTCPQGSWNGNVWTTGAITSDCSVNFSFSINTYAVTPSTGLNGSLTPNSVQMVNYGATASFTATPDSGYVKDPVITGTCPQGSWNGNVWTTGVITAACTVKFAFLSTYTITPSAGNGGNISPNTVQAVGSGTTPSFTVTADVGYTKNTTVGGTCPQGSWNGNVWTTGAITANCTVSFSFICALDNPALTWTTRGDLPWYAQTSISHDGISAMQSGPITDNQASHLETSVAGPGNLTFFWKVSSEPTYDYLQFLVDDVAKVTISGAVDWQSKTFAIPSGTHTLRWTYSKDASDGAGSDAGWVDQVTYDGGTINGTCGAANGQSLNTAPTTNLCNTGTASSVIGTGPWTWNCNGTNGGTNANCSANLATYTVTTSKTGNGSGTISGGGTFLSGTTVTLIATPDANSTFTGWNPSPCAASFTMPSNNLTCTATFSLKTYTVTPSANAGGTISPSTAQTVDYGATKQFTVTPNSNYTATVTGTCGGSLSGTTYTTNPIIADCSVIATFAPACTAAWTPQTTPTTSTLSSLVWSGTKFLAVGTSGTAITSPEGVVWNNGNIGNTNVLNSVAWSGTQFVAVSGVLDKSLIYTSADGITWTEHVSTGNPVLRGVVWNGTISKLIAVGEQGAILSSGPDATTWTVAQTGKAYVLNAITSTGTLQVAVGTGSTILTSPDGITWTQRSAPVQSVNLRTVIWNGSQFIAAGDKPMVFSSSDGTTWTVNSTPASLDFYNIEWNGSKYVAVGSTAIATSPDGISWTVVSTQTNPLRDISWSGTELVAVGDNGTVLRYCVPNQTDVITAVSYDSANTPAAWPKDGVYIAGPRTTGVDYLVNAKVFSALTGGVIESGGQLSLSLNGTIAAYLFNSQIDLIFRGLKTGDVITAIYSGTDKYRRSTGSVTIGNTYALTVATNGTGTGTVTTNQTVTPDILCGAGGTDCSQQYAKSTPAAVVTLIATAASGSSFSNWGGACSGTTTTCNVTMNAAKNVTATFTTNSTPTSYTVTPIIGKGGTVTPSTPQTVTANTAKSFTVVPKTGYIKSPKGITGTCPLGHWGGNVWTTGNITANCSVNFDFLCLICMPDRGGWRAVIEH